MTGEICENGVEMEITAMNPPLPASAPSHAAGAHSARSDNSFKTIPMNTRTTVLNSARRHAGLSAIALLSVCLLPAMRADMPMSPPAGGSMSNMPPSSTPAMKGGMKDKMDGMMGMMGMMDDKMGGMPAGSMPMTSTLPGYPGASHLYHIGATGFFLDHPEHITLTVEQQKSLNQLKEKTTLDQKSADRKIEGAEQELWTLTSADQPDASKIQAKLAECEKLRSEKRFAFIKGVGEATKLLTDEQRQSLMGNMPAMSAPQSASTQPAASGQPAMAPMKGM